MLWGSLSVWRKMVQPGTIGKGGFAEDDDITCWYCYFTILYWPIIGLLLAGIGLLSYARFWAAIGLLLACYWTCIGIILALYRPELIAQFARLSIYNGGLTFYLGSNSKISSFPGFSSTFNHFDPKMRIPIKCVTIIKTSN